MEQKIFKTLVLITMTVILINLSFSQDYEPIELAKKLMGKEIFQDISKYSTDEFGGHPNGNDIGENITFSFRTLAQTEKYAVINITLKDSLGKSVDTYLHFKKDVVWKISAFRALAMTGLLEQMKNEFEKLSDDQIDSLINLQAQEKVKIFESKEDFKYILENVKLVLESDDNIIKYFNDNKEKFENLKSKIIAFKSNSKSEDINITDELNDICKTELRELYLGNFSGFKKICDECVELTIGGIIDNFVGYFYLQDKSKLPEMTKDRIIMIREIGNGWYIFKTT